MFDDIAFPVIRNKIIDELGYAEHEVIPHINETVFAKHGKRQINLYPSIMIPAESEDQYVGQEYVSGFNVGITVRTPTFSPDTIWNLYVGDILVIMRGIVWLLRKERYAILTEINNNLSYPWKLVEPYRFAGDTAEVVAKGPAHFHADVTSADVRTDYGLFVNLRYTQARYMANVHPTHIPGKEAILDFSFVVNDAEATFTSAADGVGPFTYLWAFGDGNTSTSANPVHTYSSSGTFLVRLVMTTADHQQVVVEKQVTATVPVLDLETLTMAELETLSMEQLDTMIME